MSRSPSMAFAPRFTGSLDVPSIFSRQSIRFFAASPKYWAMPSAGRARTVVSRASKVARAWGSCPAISTVISMP